VGEFRDAFDAFMKFHVLNGEPGQIGTGVARGIAPAALVRRDVNQDDLAAARKRVALAAGRSASAADLTGTLIGVQGLGTVNPIANWHTVTNPKPVLEPVHVVDSADYIIARLEGLALEAEAGRPPSVGVAAMHPTVWGAAKRLWEDGHRRQAVAAAAEAVALMLKARIGRNDASDTSLWQQTFSDKAKPGVAQLRWPGDPADQGVISMTAGLRQFAPGVQMTIRNSATHGSGDLDEQEAIERLATLSLLARWLDMCELIEPSAGGA
jgi:hypothetical protein